MLSIAVVNQSTVVHDADVQAMVAALQTQVTRDFAPAWGIEASVGFIPKNQTPTQVQWVLAILDNADQAGALGYHDLTPAGLPLGKVFAKTTIADGAQVSVTVSHELLEMLADPDINLAAEYDDASGRVRRFYAYEVADPCEADQFGYMINSVLVSDFVFPAWFESWHKAGSAQFDQQKKISAPFQLLPGGYIGVLNLNGRAGWGQLTADNNPKTLRSARAPIGSRRDRRRTDRSCWTRSTY